MVAKLKLSSNQQGFILAAVLWTLAIMFIAVGIFNVYVQRKLAVALSAKHNIQQSLDKLSTEQSVLYLLSTSRMTLAGLTFTPISAIQQDDQNFSYVTPVGDELWLDGSPYVGIESARFSIQDCAGLIALNSPDYTVLTNFIAHFEHDAGLKNKLIDSLSDYIDADDYVSLSGAEALEYSAKGMMAPSNDYLRTEPEILRVMGWSDWLSAHPEIDLQNTFSIRKFSIMNPNAMPRNILKLHFGLSDSEADLLVESRKTNPFQSVEEFATRANKLFVLQDEDYRLFPSNELRVRIWNQGGGQAKLISLQLTPNGLLGPWQVDYEYSVQSVENNNEALAIRQSTLFNHPMGNDR